MANRYFNQFFYSFFKKPVILAGVATYTTAGTLMGSLDFPGVASITTNGTGDYTIVLQDKYSALLGFSAVIESTTSQDRIWQIDSNAVATKALGIRCLTAATPAHPVDGSKIYFKLILSNASV